MAKNTSQNRSAGQQAKIDAAREKLRQASEARKEAGKPSLVPSGLQQKLDANKAARDKAQADLAAKSAAFQAGLSQYGQETQKTSTEFQERLARETAESEAQAKAFRERLERERAESEAQAKIFQERLAKEAEAANAERLRIEERIRQIEEEARRAEEARRREEEARRAEEARKAEEARRAEEARVVREQELARQAEEARVREEEARTRREAEAARKEAERIEAERVRLENERIAAEERRAEEARKAETARVAAEESERVRVVKEQEDYRAELDRLAQKQEQDRIVSEEAARLEAERKAAVEEPVKTKTLEEAPLSQAEEPIKTKAFEETSLTQVEESPIALPPEKTAVVKTPVVSGPSPIDMATFGEEQTTAGGESEIFDKTSTSEEEASPLDTATTKQELTDEERRALLAKVMGDLSKAGPVDFGAGATGLPTGIDESNLIIEGTGGADLEKGTLYTDEGVKEQVEFWEKAAGDVGKAIYEKIGEEEKSKYTPEQWAEIEKAASGLAQAKEEETATKRDEYLQTLPQRRELSALLKANKFAEAFKYARDNNIVDLITNPAELKNLRDSFTKAEMEKFFQEMPPDLRGKDFIFNPKAGLDFSSSQWMGDKGFPAALSAFESKPEMSLASIAFDVLLASMGVPPLQSAVAKAAFTFAQTGDIKSALKAGAVAALGAKVGEMIRVPGIDELAEVIPTGSVAGTAGAVAKAASAAAAEGVVNGLTGSALQEFVVQAAKAAAPGLAETAIRSFATAAVTDLVTKPPEGPAAEPVKEPAAEPVKTPLDEAEVTVTGKAPETLTTVTPVVPTGPLGDIKPEDVAVTKEPAKAEEPPVEEEVTVTTKQPETGLGIPTIPEPPITQVKPEEIFPEYEPTKVEQPLDEAVEEEVVVKGTKPTEPVVPPIPAPPITEVKPEDILPDYKPEEVKSPLDEAVEEEVVVKGTKPTIPEPPPIVIPPSDILPDYKPEEVKQPVDEGVEEEVVVKGTKPGPTVPEPPPIVIPPGGILPDYKPTEVKPPEKSPFEKLIEEYGTFENFLKVLGALGAAGAKPPTAPTAPPAVGGLGGALPKYEIKRTQLKPDIDYYTYGTRPEVKFFDYGEQPFAPVKEPPAAGAINPKEEPKFAGGGLTGYAEGGSNEPRYFDGPGSGRDDKIPALLSDGEYVMDAETLALLGDGSTKEGARRMDKFRANIRRHKGRALSQGQISPDAKSPDKYMGGGLT